MTLHSKLLAALTAKNVWAFLVGFGAAVVVFVSSYVDVSTWSLTLGSSISLMSKVGGAALVASFAAWQGNG